jgi:hypothetical protein
MVLSVNLHLLTIENEEKNRHAGDLENPTPLDHHLNDFTLTSLQIAGDVAFESPVESISIVVASD